MKLRTFYRPDQIDNPYGEPHVKELDYKIVPRIGDEVIINEYYYKVKYVVHDTDKDEIVINLDKI
jgi:hypothetical protein